MVGDELTVRRRGIWADILKERVRQEELKAAGKFKYTCADSNMLSSEKYLVLAEEVGEVARAVLNLQNFAFDYSSDLGKVREELVQVAAVSVAWLEFIDSILYPEPHSEITQASVDQEGIRQAPPSAGRLNT